MDYDNATSLPEIFFANTAEIGDRPFLWTKRQGEWQPMTGTEAHDRAAAMSNALIALGVRKGDRVALVSESRPDWMVADIAILTTGGISVPTYTTNQISDHIHVLQDSGAKGAIVSGDTLAENLLPAALEIGLEFIISMAPLSNSPDSLSVLLWDDLIAENTHQAPDTSGILRDDTSCLIYTSGTGGSPKGVMLSHGSIISNCKGAYDLLSKLGLEEEKFLSFLPLSHSK